MRCQMTNKEPIQLIAIRLESRVVKTLDSYAKIDSTDRTDIIKRAIQKYLDDGDIKQSMVSKIDALKERQAKELEELESL